MLFEARTLSREEAQRLMNSAHGLRGVAMATVFKSAGGLAVRILRTMAMPLAWAKQRHRNRGELSRLVNIELCDMGLIRTDIPAAAGTYKRRGDAGSVDNVPIQATPIGEQRPVPAVKPEGCCTA